MEDKGFTEVLKVACLDHFYVLPSRATIVTKIHELYETKLKRKGEDLALENILL